MISGVMPRWRQYFYTIAGGFMCLLFIGFALWTTRPLFWAGPIPPPKGLWIASGMFLAVALVGVGLQLWFHRRIISEFDFDGQSFRFRTLGVSRLQTRDVSEITGVRDWRGRSGNLGYQLVFRDGGKAYLEYSVSNAIPVVVELRSRLGES